MPVSPVVLEIFKPDQQTRPFIESSVAETVLYKKLSKCSQEVNKGEEELKFSVGSYCLVKQPAGNKTHFKY